MIRLSTELGVELYAAGSGTCLNQPYSWHMAKVYILRILLSPILRTFHFTEQLLSFWRTYSWPILRGVCQHRLRTE